MEKQVMNDPITDQDRIDEIARLRLHEDEVDAILNQYAQDAAKEFKLEVGLVSIVLDGAQKFIGSYGLKGWIEEVKATPVEWAFCANSVRSGNPFIVEDSREHEIMKHSPLSSEENVVCYAGAPMITSRGHNIGNFCVTGDKSRSFTESEVNRLKDYASKAVERIESRVS